MMVDLAIKTKYINALKAVFAGNRDKREANARSRQLLADMAGDPAFFSDVVRGYLAAPGSLNTKNYPVVSMDIDLNPYFHLVAHCWIPLPDGNTDLSTKMIHHHGDMLLSTATAFGPGYEHWVFSLPEEVDAAEELYTTTILERAPHGLHDVAFVDSYIAHLPFYPSSLTITYALWSSQFPTTWRDYVKRIPLLQKNSQLLRRLAVQAGLKKQLELKASEYLDFYPTPEGLRGMRERKEYERGPNADYLPNLFHIIQETGNAHLAPLIRERLEQSTPIDNPALVEQYVDDLKHDRAIAGRLSPMHYGIAYANFTKSDIEQALAVQVSG